MTNNSNRPANAVAVRQLKKTELLALKAVAQQLQGAERAVEAARAQIREVALEIGLDPDKKWYIDGAGFAYVEEVEIGAS